MSTAPLNAAELLSAPRQPPRMVDGDQLVRRELAIDLKSTDDAKRSIDVIASTTAIDAYGEIVEQDWDLSRFKKNPVVLWNHNQSGILGPVDSRLLLPIGYADNARVEKGKLLATLVFVDEKANPLGPAVYAGFKQGSIRAVSVGFRPSAVTEEEIDGKSVYRLSGNVLCEISAVPMGANPDAVAIKKSLDRSQLRTLADETRAGHSIGGRELASLMRGDGSIDETLRSFFPDATAPESPRGDEPAEAAGSELAALMNEKPVTR